MDGFVKGVSMSAIHQPLPSPPPNLTEKQREIFAQQVYFWRTKGINPMWVMNGILNRVKKEKIK